MDIMDILMASAMNSAGQAQAAAERANEAAAAAEQAIADIYHDKELIWSVDLTDNHVVLTRYAEEEE